MIEQLQYEIKDLQMRVMELENMIRGK
jgi:hypothetical protein